LQRQNNDEPRRHRRRSRRISRSGDLVPAIEDQGRQSVPRLPACNRGM
jgi:hypothetical protein